MKILILSSEFPPNVGGIGNHGYNVALNLSKNGHEILVIADSLTQPKENLRKFEQLQPFQIQWIHRSPFVVLTYLHRIFKAVQHQKNYDVVLCSGKFSLWTGALLHLIKGRKALFAVVHGSELDLKNKWLKKLTTWSLSKMAEIISVSRYTAQFIPQNIQNQKPITIVPNGITSDEFQFELQQPQKKLMGNPSIITLGNVSQRKGQMNVIQALPMLLQRFPSIHYHIVGKPSERSSMEKKAQELGVASHLTFHGMVSREELMEKLHGSDIKAMLSDHTPSGSFEGFGIAVLEANIFGVPAIGSSNSGIADAIDQGKTGFLIDQKNSSELAKAIEEIMTHYSEFSTSARDWAKKHDWSTLIQSYEAIALRTASMDK
jgi:glycosyltransferase involved in cell wall biosynthesis